MAYCRTIYNVPRMFEWAIPYEVRALKLYPPVFETKKGPTQKNVSMIHRISWTRKRKRKEEGAGTGGLLDIHSGLLRVYSVFEFLELKISALFRYL